jgi:hypothetical protein
MAISGGPDILTDGLQLHLDAADKNSYPGSGSTWYDLSGNNRNFTIYNSSYYSFSGNNAGYIDLNRTMPPTTETGGYALHIATGSLTSANFMFNDHTTEILLRCDNANPTNYDGTEGNSALLVYRGYHCLFYGNTTNISYNLWAENNGSYSSQSTPYGEPLQQNTWVHYAATRNGDIITLYKNGEIITSNNVTTTSVVPNVSNDLVIGRAAPHSQGYSWAADMKVSMARMYTIALDPDQILQNYNATKGRFGL